MLPRGLLKTSNLRASRGIINQSRFLLLMLPQEHAEHVGHMADPAPEVGVGKRISQGPGRV